jgi:primosomal protein N' (replication factor Y)
MRRPIATPENASGTTLVLLPITVGEGYDYLTPEGMTAPDGVFVEVPLGKSFAVGVVWGPGKGGVAPEKLKPLGGLLPLAPLPEALRRFLDWVAAYTLAPKGALLKMALGGKLRLLKPKDKIAPPLPDPDFAPPVLSEEQHAAAEALCAGLGAKGVTLLDGVTGSGKTEVYAEAIAEALRQGQQALVLLPEIAMTSALVGRFAARFGAAPTLWHSGLSEKERRLNWHAIATGKARFVLGARSALFLPFPALGLIVVDEEHEAAFKQEDGVIYHARDMAVLRGKMESCPVVLASATPSLETVENVRAGKYAHLKLAARFGQARMPEVKLVDLRKERLGAQEFISAPLIRALQDAAASGHQAMLFLNRRGYAPLTLCRACGHRLQCPHCTSWLIEHKKTRRLHCHHCGFSMKIPAVCPACKAEDKFAACGPGIERIAEEVEARLPGLRFALMASDSLTSPAETETH